MLPISSSPRIKATANMNGASDFSRLVYLASAASGVAGGIVYVARQLVTKDDLKEAKAEIEKDLKNFRSN